MSRSREKLEQGAEEKIKSIKPVKRTAKIRTSRPEDFERMDVLPGEILPEEMEQIAPEEKIETKKLSNDTTEDIKGLLPTHEETIPNCSLKEVQEALEFARKNNRPQEEIERWEQVCKNLYREQKPQKRTKSERLSKRPILLDPAIDSIDESIETLAKNISVEIPVIKNEKKESVEELLSGQERPVIDLIQLDQKAIRITIQELDPKDLVVAMNNYLEKIKLEDLDLSQQKKEKNRINNIGEIINNRLNKAQDLLDKGELTDPERSACRELEIILDKLRDLYDKIDQQEKKTLPTDKSPEEAAKPEEPTKETINEAFEAKEETEAEIISSQIENLKKALEINTDEVDRDLIKKQIEYLQQKIKTSPGSEKKPEQTLLTEPVPVVTSTENKEKIPKTSYTEIKEKMQQIEQAEQKMAIYRPLGWFRKKPVVRDLGYYAGEAELKKLKLELKELTKQRRKEIKTKNLDKTESENSENKDIDAKIEKIVEETKKRIEKENINTEKKEKTKKRFLRKIFSGLFRRRQLSEEEIETKILKKIKPIDVKKGKL